MTNGWFNWTGGELELIDGGVTVGTNGTLGPILNLTGGKVLSINEVTLTLTITNSGTVNLTGGQFSFNAQGGVISSSDGELFGNVLQTGGVFNVSSAIFATVGFLGNYALSGGTASAGSLYLSNGS